MLEYPSMAGDNNCPYYLAERIRYEKKTDRERACAEYLQLRAVSDRWARRRETVPVVGDLAEEEPAPEEQGEEPVSEDVAELPTEEVGPTEEEKQSNIKRFFKYISYIESYKNGAISKEMSVFL